MTDPTTPQQPPQPAHAPDVVVLDVIPHRLLLERWHNRTRRGRALSWLRATLSRDPVTAHAERLRTLPAWAVDRYLRGRGIDQW